jgi:hypothetical protein
MLTTRNYVQHFPQQTLMQNSEFADDTLKFDKDLAGFLFGDNQSAHTLGIDAIEQYQFPANFKPADYTYRFSHRYTGALVDVNIRAAKAYSPFLDKSRNKLNTGPYADFFQSLQTMSDDIKAGKLAN